MDPLTVPSHQSARSTQLRVGLATPAWPSSVVPNGIATYVEHLADALRRSGRVEPCILAGTVGASEQGAASIASAAGPAPVLERRLNRLWSMVSPHEAFMSRKGRELARAVAWMRRSQDIDLFEIEEAYGPSEWIRRRVDIPVVVRLHGPWFLNGAAMGSPHDAEFRAREASERKAIMNAHAVSSPSLDVLQQVRAHYGLALTDAAVIPNGIAIPEDHAAWSLEACDRNLLLFVGRFDSHKGADVLLRAFARLAERQATARLLFVGPTTGSLALDGRSFTLDEFLTAHIPAPTRQRIEFAGFVSGPALLSLRRRAFLTVVPSRYETFSMTTLESLAFGCPTIGADSGAIPELIDAGSTGLLFDPEDANDLAETMQRLLEAPDWAASLGAAARLRARREFDATAVTARMADFYAETLARHGPGFSTRRRRSGLQGGVVA